MRRKNRRLLRQAFKIAGADKILVSYLIFYIIATFLIWFTEPDIKSVYDSLWYCFAVATSVGFGDFTAATHSGRIITVILSVYSIGAIAIFTAVLTSYFLDIAKAKASDSAREFLDDLEHLTELSKDELKALSERVKKFEHGKRFK